MRWLYDGVFAVTRGGAEKVVAETVAGSWDEAEAWLVRTAIELYPESTFALLILLHFEHRRQRSAAAMTG